MTVMAYVALVLAAALMTLALMFRDSISDRALWVCLFLSFAAISAAFWVTGP
jgi:hypothetical protein